jgi:hypothetical protein
MAESVACCCIPLPAACCARCGTVHTGTRRCSAQMSPDYTCAHSKPHLTGSHQLTPYTTALLAAACLAHQHDRNHVEHDDGGPAGDAVWPVEGEGGAKLPHLCMLVNSRSGGGAGGELVRKLSCVPHCTILDLSPDAFAAAAESPVSTSTRVQVPPAPYLAT